MNNDYFRSERSLRMEKNMTNKPSDKREAILQAALEIFAENGFHSSPTSQISKLANVGTGTIYRYFDSKDALIEALHEKIDTHLREIAWEDIDEQASVRDNLFNILDIVFHFLLSNPHEFRFLEQYYNSPYGLEMKRAKGDVCDRPLINLFEQGIDQQIIKKLPIDLLFALCFGPMIHLIRDQLTGYLTITDEMIQATIKAAWDSIRL